MNLLTQMALDDTINAVYQGLRHSRRDNSHDNDVWHLRFHWQKLKPQIQIKNEGFDFLGYRIMKNKKLRPTWTNRKDKVRQLYEQNASFADIGTYIKQWFTCLGAGVNIKVEEAIAALP